MVPSVRRMWSARGPTVAVSNRVVRSAGRRGLRGPRPLERPGLPSAAVAHRDVHVAGCGDLLLDAAPRLVEGARVVPGGHLAAGCVGGRLRRVAVVETGAGLRSQAAGVDATARSRPRRRSARRRPPPGRAGCGRACRARSGRPARTGPSARARPRPRRDRPRRGPRPARPSDGRPPTSARRRMRLTRNPGHSRTRTGTLPRAVASSSAAAIVASLVVSPRMTSTSFITLAGLKKWSPTTRSGRLVSAASAVMERPEVFEARIAPAGRAASRTPKTWRLRSRISGTASIARSQSARSEASIVGWTRDSDRLRVLGAHPPALHAAVADRGDVRHPALQRLRDGVEQPHLDAPRGGRLGDLAAHHAGPEYRHPSDHDPPSLFGCPGRAGLTHGAASPAPRR